MFSSRKRILNAVAIFGVIVLGGCAGGTQTAVPTTWQGEPRGSTVMQPSAIVRLRAATPAAPLDPRTPLSQLGVVHQQNLAGQPYIAGIRPPGAISAMLDGSMFNKTKGMHPMSIVRYYDTGGQAGLVLNQRFDDNEAVLTAYGSNQVPIPQPPGGSQYPNEIATTMHAGQQPIDGTTNCLEIATIYQTWYGQAPQANLEVGDWCKQPGNELFPLIYSLDDSNFVANYVRDLGNGFPDVQVELYQPLGGDGSWHAGIYNFAYSRWDILPYHTYGSAGYDPTLQYSWDIAETHYYPGPCAVIPTMASFNFQGAVETGNDQQNYWRLIQSGDVNPSLPGNPDGADCFSNDGTNQGGVYHYSVTAIDSAWQVTDPGPSPSPRPSFTPRPPRCPPYCAKTKP